MTKSFLKEELIASGIYLTNNKQLKFSSGFELFGFRTSHIFVSLKKPKDNITHCLVRFCKNKESLSQHLDNFNREKELISPLPQMLILCAFDFCKYSVEEINKQFLSSMDKVMLVNINFNYATDSNKMSKKTKLCFCQYI